jgi:hypothetical protein
VTKYKMTRPQLEPWLHKRTTTTVRDVKPTPCGPGKLSQ